MSYVKKTLIDFSYRSGHSKSCFANAFARCCFTMAFGCFCCLCCFTSIPEAPGSFPEGFPEVKQKLSSRKVPEASRKLPGSFC